MTWSGHIDLRSSFRKGEPLTKKVSPERKVVYVTLCPCWKSLVICWKIFHCDSLLKLFLMSIRPLWPDLRPRATDPLWFNADKPCDDESEVAALEAEHQAWVSVQTSSSAWSTFLYVYFREITCGCRATSTFQSGRLWAM